MTLSRTLTYFTLSLIVLCSLCIISATSLQALVDMGQVAYVSSDGGPRDIYLIDVAHHIKINLTHSETDEYAPTWSPDGKAIAYVGNVDRLYDIYMQEIPRGKPQRITHNALLEHNIVWSPDGAYIAFTSDNVYNEDIFYGRRTKLFMVDMQHNRTVRDYIYVASSQSSLTWSPDGTSMAYMAITDGGQNAIVTASLADIIQADSNTQPRMNEISNGRYPSWSGDGQYIALQAPSGGSWDIYSVTLDGQQINQLTDNLASDYMPAWSPHSDWVAFVSWRDKNEEIYIVNSHTRQEIRLTFSKTNESDPIWRP